MGEWGKRYFKELSPPRPLSRSRGNLNISPKRNMIGNGDSSSRWLRVKPGSVPGSVIAHDHVTHLQFVHQDVPDEVLGAELRQGAVEPLDEDEQEFQLVMSLFRRHMNSIAGLLMEQSEDFEPMFNEHIVDGKTYTIVDEWCEGYMRGVMMASEQWEQESIEMQILLAPIKAFQGEQAFNTDEKIKFVSAPRTSVL